MQSTPKSEPAVAADENSCLVCDSRLSIARSLNVLRAPSRKNGEISVKCIARILRLSSAEIRCACLCARCSELFRSLERAQRTVNATKREILKVYRSGGREIAEKTLVARGRSSETSIFADGRDSEEIERDEYQESVLRREGSIENPIGNGEKTFLPSADVVLKVENSGFRAARSNEDESRFRDLSPLRSEGNCDFDEDEKTEDIAALSAEEKIRDAASGFAEERDGGQESWKNSSPRKEIPRGERAEKLVDALCESGEESRKSESTERGSWKSGRISKYSQKPLKYSCGSCDKKWRTLAELKTHVRSHSNLRPYMCEKCGQAYKHKHALEIHVGMHNGVSPYRCNVCDKCFTQKGALMRHLPMHTGETPYQCELCGKRFVHHTSYNMHALSHTGKKSYRCHLCDLSLLSTSHLKRHMRVHTGEKPYSCSLCGKSFAERYNLFAHRKIHEPTEIMSNEAKKNSLKCDRCDDYFDDEEKLERHKIEHASDDTSRGKHFFSPAYDVNLTARNAESYGTRRDDSVEAEDAWSEMDYRKFDNSQIVSMTLETDNEIIASKALTLV